MPRYDDRNGNTRLFVGRLSSRTRSRDLENLFSRYGRVRDVDLKHDFAFIEFSDPRDADDARYSLNGREFDGSRITVEFAKGSRGSGGSREYLGRGPPLGSGRCFNCGIDGHWARDCKADDWKNKCYRCGERGHIERNCKNSPKSLKRRSYSKSPSPRRGRSRSRSFSRSRSYSRSRSPPRKAGRGAKHERGSGSPGDSRSPKAKKSPPPPTGRKQRSSPADSSQRERGSTPPTQAVQRNGSDYSMSPKNNGRSPSPEESSPVGKSYRSPKTGGRSPSPSPSDHRSPVADDDDNRGYARRGDSPYSD